VIGRRASQIALAALAVAAAGTVARRLGGHAAGRHVPGGILMPDAGAYDAHSARLFAGLFRGIASDIAEVAPPDARILEVGCGPGHLSVRLARHHDFDVVGLDLDPAMIERASANAKRVGAHGRQPTFIVGDVAKLPFDDTSFDLVVSTFSMHHWSDPNAGLNEIARVLRADGKALIWDLKPGFRLFHAHAPDPVEQVRGSALAIVSARRWRWPWRFTLSQRLELTRR
jgi:SAM-dependent methyltransferase